MRRGLPTRALLPRLTRGLLSGPPVASVDGTPSFNFKCTQCGKCCTGKGGRVRVNDREIEELERVLRISTQELKDKYLNQVQDDTPSTGSAWLIRQTDDDTQCVFLDGKRCSVYEARPTQCRTFPWWPQNLISSYDWQLAARHCEGIILDAPVDSGDEQRRLEHVLPEAVVYDIHRSGENYNYDELHEMLRDLQDLDPSFLSEYEKELRDKFHRHVVYQDESVTVLDTFLDGACPTRSFVFNDRLHLVQSEMELLHGGGGSETVVDPSRLMLDVHQAMCLALPWLSSRKPRDWRVALLGSGGGSLVRYILHEKGDSVTRLDAVEPNAVVNNVARRFFGLLADDDQQPSTQQSDIETTAVTLHEAFGEDFVQRQLDSQSPLYDLFMVDVEAGAPSDTGVLAPPASMLSSAFLMSVRELLSDVGIVAINVITEDGHALQQVAATVAETFDASSCAVVRLPKNTALFAFKHASPVDHSELQTLVSNTSTQSETLATVVVQPLSDLLH